MGCGPSSAGPLPKEAAPTSATPRQPVGSSEESKALLESQKGKRRMIIFTVAITRRESGGEPWLLFLGFNLRQLRSSPDNLLIIPMHIAVSIIGGPSL